MCSLYNGNTLMVSEEKNVLEQAVNISLSWRMLGHPICGLQTSSHPTSLSFGK